MTSTRTKQPSWTWLPTLFEYNEDGAKIAHATIVRQLSPGIILVLKALPKAAQSTTVECSIYAANIQPLDELSELKRSISWEIKQLGSKQQRIVSNQEPILSLASSVATQEDINKLLGEHLEAEMNLGAEIHPAAREQSFSPEGKADDDCK